MAKFYGGIGFSVDVETSPGVFTPQSVERPYYGDVLRNTNRVQNGESINDDITLDNKLSIVADAFAYENFQHLRYVKWMGAFWKINSVDVQRPRLILSIGGVYNGPTA